MSNQQPDHRILEIRARWLETERLLDDKADPPDDITRLALEDERAALTGDAIDTRALTLDGWIAKSRVLLDIISAAAPDDPAHDLAASLAEDLLHGRDEG